jgi:hypothetical protein
MRRQRLLELVRPDVDIFRNLLLLRSNDRSRSMAVDENKPEVAQTESHIDRNSNDASSNEKQPHVPAADEDYNVTWKTWVVVWILAWSYGISFWIVPSLAAAQAVVSAQLGDVTKQAWYVSTYTVTVTIAFMVCGANSDLFGRRWFIIGGSKSMVLPESWPEDNETDFCGRCPYVHWIHYGRSFSEQRDNDRSDGFYRVWRRKCTACRLRSTGITTE